MEFYRLDKEEIINTKTDILQEDLEKKQILPVVRLYPEVLETEIPKREDGTYILDDKVEVVKNNIIKVLTLEQVKEDKIKLLKIEYSTQFPQMFKQVNAILGEYDEDKCQEIKDSIHNTRLEIDKKEKEILALTTIEYVEEYVI